MLLTTARTYRAPAFLDAADKLGVSIVQAIDAPQALTGQHDNTLLLDFRDVETAVTTITDYAQKKPLNAVLAVDDSGSLLAAHASAALNLPHNHIAAAEAARDKFRMRQLLSLANVNCPHFQLFHTGMDPQTIAPQVNYPCVVKPTTLSGSRGVIRANEPQELVSAINRLARLLAKVYGPGERPFLVEDYIPGVEVALEGLLEDGRLRVLALFDKPDPLEGPFFEETLYITPSRLDTAVQAAITTETARAAAALGLRAGPLHAELRINAAGAWIVEVAGRSIGGLCARTLQFGVDVSLEELILRQACGLPVTIETNSAQARGVMMIPIPAAGLLRGVTGIEAAKAAPLVEDVVITASLHNPLTPLPEGESYLGFIFAKGESPATVETALRHAHQKLHFQIDALLPLLT